MSFERLVGLQVTNDEKYAQYRAAMSPLLKEHDGGFRYDFKVSEVLKNEEGRPINRVFVIYFGSKELMEKFFSHPEYLKIRSEYFDSSVGTVTGISAYERS